MPITFNHATQRIGITAPTTSLTMQELIDAIRIEEYTALGIAFPKIANASGKDQLGGSVQVGITISLLENWQLEPYPGNYTLVIGGGNLVQATTNDPIAFVAGGPQVELTQSVSASIVSVNTGSGLDTDQDARLTRIEQFLRNKFVTDPITGKARLYDDSGISILFDADIFEDAAGVVPYTGNGIERRDRLE